MITVLETESDIRITTDTPYLALTGELRGVYFKDFGENWPRYNGTALYWVRWDVFRHLYKSFAWLSGLH